MDNTNQQFTQNDWGKKSGLITDLGNMYIEKKEKDEITEKDMKDMYEFLIQLCESVDDDGFFLWLYNEVSPEIRAAIGDLFAFMPKYEEIRYKEFIKKMDDFEIAESELLFDAIWKRNTRVSIEGYYLDWDEEVEDSIELTIPKKNREECKYTLKLACAIIVYNRGSMVIRFFVRRGMYEIAAITVFNGTGEWENVPEYEINSLFDEGLFSNEKAIFLEHGDSPEITVTGKVMKFPR